MRKWAITPGARLFAEDRIMNNQNPNAEVNVQKQADGAAIGERIALLASANKSTHRIFQADVKNVHAQVRLLPLVIASEDNENKTRAVLKKHPHLLLQSGVVHNHTGQPICGTAYQIALKEKDVEMIKMMESAFKELKDGPAEMQKQYNEVFPEGWETPYKEHWQPVYSALDRITTILLHAQQDAKDDKHPNNELKVGANWYDVVVNDRIQNEFDQFEKALHDATRVARKTGFNMDDQILQKAYDLYKLHYQALGDRYNAPKNMFFCQRIIGTIQKYLPANYLQAFAYGIDDIVDKKVIPPRTTKFRYDNFSILPLGANADWVLGKNCWAWDARGTWLRTAGGGCRRISNFLSIKNNQLSELTPRPFQQPMLHHVKQSA
ncbi:MAG TPA: hypothetical protein VHA52_13835 [Candidatus Babeliaceae bacterium]|nr:hypothetical protein [Candidatus Babeliaceae bacterium]